MSRLVSERPARSAAVLSLIGNTPLVPLVFQAEGVTRLFADGPSGPAHPQAEAVNGIDPAGIQPR